MEYIKKYWIVGLIILLGIIINILMIFKSSTPQELKMIKTYQRILISDPVSSKIDFKQVFKRGSSVRLKMSDETKFSIGQSRNDLYGEKTILAYFLRKGDSLFKRKNSDTLFVYRGYKEYYFVLNKRINIDYGVHKTTDRVK
jgi:hypothetical protein